MVWFSVKNSAGTTLPFYILLLTKHHAMKAY